MTLDQLQVEKLPLSFAIIDHHHRLIAVSPKWVEQFPDTNPDLNPFLERTIDPLPKNLFLDIDECMSQNRECLGKGTVHLNKKVFGQYFWRISPFEESNHGAASLVMLQLDLICDKGMEEDLKLKSLEVARIGGWELDLRNNTLHWSSITKEIHEVPPDYLPDLKEGIYFYKEGKSRDTISELVSNGIEKGIPWDTELQIVTAKGKELWVRAIGETEMIKGKCTRIFGTFQDIDRRKLAELNSKKATDRLKLATKSADIGIWEYDLSTGYIEWGDVMYQIYGLRPSEFDNSYEGWKSLLHPSDRNRTTSLFESCLERGKNFNTIFKISHTSGEIRWIKVVGTLLKNGRGQLDRIIGTNQDVTELTKIQGQLHKSEASFRGAFQNSSIGMALVDLDGTFLDVNPSLCESLGYSKLELKKMTFQEITHEDDLDKDIEKLKAVIAGQRNTYQLEKRYFTRSGQELTVLLTVTGVHRLDGSLSHFISQILDITTKIKAEKKLKRVLQLTTDQNESLTNFAHIVSHNLRSHAANLSMITGFLIDGDITEEEKMDTMKMLRSATEGLNETIKHLNEVVQVQTQSKDQQKIIFPSLIVQKVLSDIAALIEENDVHFEIDIAKDLKISAVPAYFESIVLNLATNAIKYRSPERPGRVYINSSVKNDMVMLTVSDNGLGIDMAKYGDKIFGMYKTFHKHKDSKGIGLFITKNQVESMGGKIQVESKENVGTSFTIELEKA